MAHVLNGHPCPVTASIQGPQRPGTAAQQAARVRGPWSKVLLGQVSTTRRTCSRTQRGGNRQTKGALLMAAATLPKPQIFCGENSQWAAVGAKTQTRHLRREIGFRGGGGGGAHTTRRTFNSPVFLPLQQGKGTGLCWELCNSTRGSKAL